MSSAAKKLITDVAMELSGLSSAKRIYDEDIKPYTKGIRGKRVFRSYSGAARRLKKKARTLGFPVGTDSALRSETIVTSMVGKNTRSLYVNQLTSILEKASFTHVAGRRDRQIVNCRGFKLHAEFRNDLNVPLYLNVAVLAPKHLGALPNTVDFFRSFGDTTRSENFAGGLTALQIHHSPINLDIYEILSHDRFTLGPDLTGGDYHMQKASNILTYNKWVKLDRQLRFDSTNNCETPVYFVYWCDRFGEASGAPSVLNALRSSEWHAVYWKNSC